MPGKIVIPIQAGAVTGNPPTGYAWLYINSSGNFVIEGDDGTVVTIAEVSGIGPYQPASPNLDMIDGLTLTNDNFLQVKASAITERTLAQVRADLFPVAGFSTYGAGTAYALTATSAAIDLGTTDPSISITTPGSYILRGQVHLKYNGATFAANRTVTLKYRRTNNTPADLSDGSIAIVTDIVTTKSQTFLVVQLPEIDYTTANSDDAIALYADVDVVPTAGSLDVNASGTFLKASRRFN